MTAAPELEHGPVDRSPAAAAPLRVGAAGGLGRLGAVAVVGRPPAHRPAPPRDPSPSGSPAARGQGGHPSPGGSADCRCRARQPWTRPRPCGPGSPPSPGPSPAPRAGCTCCVSATRPPVSIGPCKGRAVGASTPATTGAGPRTSSAASTSTTTPAWTGAGRLVQVALAAGLSFELAWLEYPATRGRERRLKNQGSAYRRCPLCRGTGGPLDPAAAVAAVQHTLGGRP